jgi:hypothetical protein
MRRSSSTNLSVTGVATPLNACPQDGTAYRFDLDGRPAAASCCIQACIVAGAESKNCTAASASTTAPVVIATAAISSMRASN